MQSTSKCQVKLFVSRMDPYLLLQHTVEDENEHALKGVEDGEKVGHDHGALVDIHQAKGPSQAQQAQQGNGPDHPRSGIYTKQLR